MALNTRKLAEAIIESKLLTEEALENLLKQGKIQNLSLEDLLFERELISDEKLIPVISKLYEVEPVRISEKSIPDALLRIIPYKLAASQYIIPYENTGEQLKIATASPDNHEIKNFIEKKTGLKVVFFYSTKKEISIALKAYNRDVNEKFNKLLEGVMRDPKKIESLKDAAKILDTIILFAFQNNTSDIHIEPHRDFLIIRYRMDGILKTIAELPIEIMDLITTRIKVLANMRTDEHRAAQDGRFKIELENNEITMRVSIVPTYDGEKTVLRLLTSTNQGLNLASMGYSPENLNIINRNIVKTTGILLVTGPTGSGKTTTLYSILRILNSPEVNLSTVEDPIEYRLEGVNQIQVNRKTDLTFANGLRALLRQDPDVILIGEIRDEETATIAVNAALTGHLVLATVHTNDAPSTIPRMAEMGVEPFLLGATLQMIIAQRLVRTICEKCKSSYQISMAELRKLEEKFNVDINLEQTLNELAEKTPEIKSSFANGQVTLYKGEGCGNCGTDGYKGRSSVAEVLEVSDPLKEIIINGADQNKIVHQVKSERMITLFEDGMRKVLAGKTTLEEILRVLRS